MQERALPGGRRGVPGRRWPREPYNATAAYNLGLALTRAGQAEEGQTAHGALPRSCARAATAPLLGQSYPEQGRYAEALASTGAEATWWTRATPAVRFVGRDAPRWLPGRPARRRRRPAA